MLWSKLMWPCNVNCTEKHFLPNHRLIFRHICCIGIKKFDSITEILKSDFDILCYTSDIMWPLKSALQPAVNNTLIDCPTMKNRWEDNFAASRCFLNQNFWFRISKCCSQISVFPSLFFTQSASDLEGQNLFILVYSLCYELAILWPWAISQLVGGLNMTFILQSAPPVCCMYTWNVHIYWSWEITVFANFY